MSWVIVGIIGAIIGWLASYAMSPDRRSNMLLNIVSGIVGALLGVWFFAGVLGLITASAGINFWLVILWSIVGALILMGIVAAIAQRYMMREGMYREDRYREPTMGRSVPHEYKREDEEVYDEEEIRRRRRRR